MTGIMPTTFSNINQVAGYEAQCMVTAYHNHIKQRFGSYLRCAINQLLGVKVAKKQLLKEMAGKSVCQIHQACEEKIWQPAREIKQAIGQQHPDLSRLSTVGKEVLANLSPILTAYPDTYEFSEDSIYYDVKASPQCHFKAFFELFLPKDPSGDQQGGGGGLSLQAPLGGGMASPKKKGKHKYSEVDSPGDIKYIHDVPQSELWETVGKCVLIDPGRRDLLFCMHESSTTENRQQYHYTRCQRAKETRMLHFHKLCEKAKDSFMGGAVRLAEARLGQECCRTLDPAVYSNYIR
ncbi:hypothetical protein IWQ61_010357, partial [Dispira simplex]